MISLPFATGASSLRAARRALLVILLLAFALRVAEGVRNPASDWPDEVFQTREPAHRLAFGYGVVTWEWRDGIRSWVLPGLLAGVMKATAWMGPGSYGYNTAIVVVLSAISLAIVWAAFWWGYRAGGLAAAILAGAACAIWWELIYYAPQALTEVVAAHLLLPALYIAQFEVSLPVGNRGRLVIAGALMGGAIGLRVHLAPAVLVALLYVCRLNWRKWLDTAAGITAALLVFGIVDWLTWGAPFASYYRSILVNVVQKKSESYGTEPPGWYFQQLAERVGPILLLAVFAVRRNLLLALTAAAIVGTHCAFAHKEYRFIVPALPLLAVLVALGAWELLSGVDRRTSRPPRRAAVVSVALAVIAFSNIVYGLAGNWTRQVAGNRAMEVLSVTPDVCGVAVQLGWELSGGYSYLHRDVPLYSLPFGPIPPEQANYQIGYSAPAHYQPTQCWPDERAPICLWKRPGACTKPDNYDINSVLKQARR